MATNNIPVVEEDQADTAAAAPSAAGNLPGVGATVKFAAPKGGGMSVPGVTSLDENQTQDVIDRLQKFVDEKDTNKGFLNPLMKGLNLGYATTYGPDVFQRTQAHYDTQDKAVQDALATMGSLSSSLASNKAFIQAANTPSGGVAGAPGAAGPGGTMPVQGGQLSPIDTIIAGLPPLMKEKANVYKKIGTRAAYEEIMKMGGEYEIKGRTSESKNRAEIFAMPEGPDKDIAMQEYFSKSYQPVSTFQGGFETKTTGAGAARVPGAPSALPPSTSFINSAAAAGIPIISGVRTPLGQAELRHHKDPETGQWMTKENRPVAEDSKHLTGNAIDVNPAKPLDAQQRAWLEANAYRPDPAKDANHWERKPVAAQTPTQPKTALPTGIPGGTTEGAKYSVEQATKQNDMARDAILKPLLEVQQRNLALPAQIDNAIATLNKTKVGPGTGLKQLMLEAKGTFTNLPPDEMKYLASLRTLDSVGKKIILSDAKGLLPGSFSDSDRAYIDKTGYGINDPKEFVKSTLELKKASVLANNDYANYLSRPENSGRIDEAKAQYIAEGRGMKILRENAPTLFKYEKKAENKAAAAPTTVHTDDAARAWLEKNPNDPKAAAVRKSLEGK
jgi:hypothetical protein